eukprot:6213060-Pleurochrysis_carterae.AAC.3
MLAGLSIREARARAGPRRAAAASEAAAAPPRRLRQGREETQEIARGFSSSPKVLRKKAERVPPPQAEPCSTGELTALALAARRPQSPESPESPHLLSHLLALCVPHASAHAEPRLPIGCLRASRPRSASCRSRRTWLGVSVKIGPSHLLGVRVKVEAQVYDKESDVVILAAAFAPVVLKVLDCRVVSEQRFQRDAAAATDANARCRAAHPAQHAAAAAAVLHGELDDGEPFTVDVGRQACLRARARPTPDEGVRARVRGGARMPVGERARMRMRGEEERLHVRVCERGRKETARKYRQGVRGKCSREGGRVAEWWAEGKAEGKAGGKAGIGEADHERGRRGASRMEEGEPHGGGRVGGRGGGAKELQINRESSRAQVRACARARGRVCVRLEGRLHRQRGGAGASAFRASRARYLDPVAAISSDSQRGARRAARAASRRIASRDARVSAARTAAARSRTDETGTRDTAEMLRQYVCMRRARAGTGAAAQ